MAVRPLSEMKTGEGGVISRVGGERGVRRRLLEMGVIPRTAVVMERMAPMGDPVWIRLKGYQLSLRKDEAASVFVEVA